jgi:hypothetical protein
MPCWYFWCVKVFGRTSPLQLATVPVTVAVTVQCSTSNVHSEYLSLPVAPQHKRCLFVWRSAPRGACVLSDIWGTLSRWPGRSKVGKGKITVDELRRGIEGLPGTVSYSATYYEKWAGD